MNPVIVKPAFGFLVFCVALAVVFVIALSIVANQSRRRSLPPERRRPSRRFPLAAAAFAFVAFGFLIFISLFYARMSHQRDVTERRAGRARASAWIASSTQDELVFQGLEPPSPPPRPDARSVVTPESSPSPRSSLPEIVVSRVPLELPRRDPLEVWNEIGRLRDGPLSPQQPEPEPVGKPWVLDAGGGSEIWIALEGSRRLRLRHPHAQTGYLAGYSRQWETSEPAALAEALDSLVAQVLLLWINETAEGNARREELDGEAARARVAEVLRAQTQPLVRDIYVDSSRRDYGEVHRAAVLARIDPPVLQTLHHAAEETLAELRQEQAAARQRLLWQAAQMAGLGLTVFLLYSFLNAGTQGYFAWPLRIVSLVLLCLLYAGLFFLGR